MSNYASCVSELAPRLKKRGMENPDGMAASMCAIRFADDEETPRQFLSQAQPNRALTSPSPVDG